MQVLMRLLLVSFVAFILSSTSSASDSATLIDLANIQVTTSEEVSLARRIASQVNSGKTRVLRSNDENGDLSPVSASADEERGFTEWIRKIVSKLKGTMVRRMKSEIIKQYGSMEKFNDKVFMDVYKKNGWTPDDLRAKALGMSNKGQQLLAVRILSLYEPWFKKAVAEGRIKA
ncbi:unnamed protein product [Phytophthora lilii]|uniref:RxLR effector protein n=1 Tax=Phytophthora lilii TaxID=2077276 RepID=A0A9W6WV96_9STRA|nr:unnamed protein product [Phytophthora lilii]